MASILLLDSSAATARRTVRLHDSAGQAVRTTGDVVRMLQPPASAPFVIVVRDHAESPVDPSPVRRLRSAPHAGALLVPAPAVRWVARVVVADRVLSEGISGDLLLDAIRKTLDPAPAMVVASRATSGPADIAVSADAVDAALPVVGIAGYRMLKLIGQGGISVVYLAAHEASGEHRVLKLLPISEHDGGVLVQRLINEAALLAQLRHPASCASTSRGVPHGTRISPWSTCPAGS